MSDPLAPPGLKTETLPPPPPLPTEGPARGVGFAFDPKWLDWVPVACLLLAFALTFFPWAEMKLGGYTVMSQNGWGTLFASVGEPTLPKSAEWEKLDKGFAAKAEDERYNAAVLRSDWLVLLYLLLLLLAVLLFAAERVIRDPAVFPATAKLTFLPPLWKWRLVAMGGVAVLAFLVLWFQAFQGFGLQRSVNNFAYFEYNQKQAELSTNTERRDMAIRGGQTAGQYAVHQTPWLNLLLVLHAVAVVSLAARFWLDSRGAKPLPRLDMRW